MESEIFIDSLRRDTAAYPNSNNYVVYLRSPLKKVYEAELISAIFQRTTSDRNAILDIQELRNDKLKAVYSLNEYSYFGPQSAGGPSSMSALNSAGESVSRSFGVISIADTTINSNVVYNQSTNYKICSRFNTPIEYVDRFTINWRDQNGNLLPTSDNTILLRIKHAC